MTMPYKILDLVLAEYVSYLSRHDVTFEDEASAIVWLTTALMYNPSFDILDDDAAKRYPEQLEIIEVDD